MIVLIELARQHATQLDLSKAYWQIPLTNRAKRLSAFVTPAGLYQYRVMPFKNAPATFQWMINHVVGKIDGCEAYIDDVVVHSTECRLGDSYETCTRIVNQICRCKAHFESLQE